jgi:hypothetical protein
MITQFGLHPVELLELFSTLGNYLQWFHIDAAPLQVWCKPGWDKNVLNVTFLRFFSMSEVEL